MKVVSLTIYPVKGCGGISLTEFAVTAKGAEYDREWMVVDGQGKFITQRTFPQLAAIKLSLDARDLVLRWQGKECRIPLLRAERPLTSSQVWNSVVQAEDEGDGAAAFVSQVLGSPHRVVRYKEERGSGEGVVSFADKMPFLLTGTASLAELNRQLKEAVPMNRFRPNIVVETTQPYAEDHWSEVKIGAVVLKVTGQCSRCVVTTIDQESGESKGPEPLKTLAQVRRQGNKVPFGMHATPLALGKIRVGDEVFA